MYNNILIDGRNIVYRSVAASLSKNSDGTHPVTIFIRLMDKWRRLFKPEKWRVFWDVSKDKIWRSDIYPEYKGGRPSYSDEFKKLICDTQKFSAMIFSNMCVTQYIKSNNEADDLIYAFVYSNQDKKNIIISSDGDMPQIPFRLKCDLHNPGFKNQLIFPVPEHDPVIIKSLSGDASDNIKNYRLVAKKTAIKIIEKGLDDFLNEKGRELFDLNVKLIDLSKNPFLEDNVKYVNSVKDNEKFDLNAIKDIAINNSITGLYADLISKVRPFKNTQKEQS